MKCNFHSVLIKKKLYIYIYIYILGYESIRTCFYATPSFMLAQSSGIVGLALFSCYLKARKEIRKYHLMIHDINP